MYSKYELQNVISGNAKVRDGEIIQTIVNFLREKKRAIQKSEESKFFKGEETEVLIQFINHHQLWIESIDESKYIGEGAEQKVYEHTEYNFDAWGKRRNPQNWSYAGVTSPSFLNRGFYWS